MESLPEANTEVQSPILATSGHWEAGEDASCPLSVDMFCCLLSRTATTAAGHCGPSYDYIFM